MPTYYLCFLFPFLSPLHLILKSKAFLLTYFFIHKMPLGLGTLPVHPSGSMTSVGDADLFSSACYTSEHFFFSTSV